MSIEEECRIQNQFFNEPQTRVRLVEKKPKEEKEEKEEKKEIFMGFLLLTFNF
ncbi:MULTISPECIES: hypothetical protein [unclassified Nostoc]|uniref:hypothetical protein n=1 Tax=unclassified Nostoc TaxID=2593658 RepID=UPI00262D500E|nr:hypothetical protein [Nostoc sp. S13]MDF5735428.1 hypothetical protein [Nostoc sp. S13]